MQTEKQKLTASSQRLCAHSSLVMDWHKVDAPRFK